MDASLRCEHLEGAESFECCAVIRWYKGKTRSHRPLHTNPWRIRICLSGLIRSWRICHVTVLFRKPWLHHSSMNRDTRRRDRKPNLYQTIPNTNPNYSSLPKKHLWKMTLRFENESALECHKEYFIPTLEISFCRFRTLQSVYPAYWACDVFWENRLHVRSKQPELHSIFALARGAWTVKSYNLVSFLHFSDWTILKVLTMHRRCATKLDKSSIWHTIICDWEFHELLRTLRLWWHHVSLKKTI